VPAENRTPTVLAMIVCDQVIRDIHTGKVTIVGSFNQISGSDFPLVHSNFAIYVAITEGQGQYEGKLRFSIAETDDAVLEASGPFTLDHPLQVAELNFHVQALPLPKPGKYRIEFFANGERLTGRSFVVKAGEQEELKEGA